MDHSGSVSGQEQSLFQLRELAKPDILNALTQLQGRVPPSLEQPLQQLLQALTQGQRSSLSPGAAPNIAMDQTDPQQKAAATQLAAIYSRLTGSTIATTTLQPPPVQQALQQWQLQVQLLNNPDSWHGLSAQEQRCLQQQGISQPTQGTALAPVLQQKLAQLNTLLLAAQESSAPPATDRTGDIQSQTTPSSTGSSSPAAITLLSPRQQLWQQIGQTLQAIRQQIQQLGTDPARQQPAQALLRQIEVLARQLQPQMTLQSAAAAQLDALQSQIGPAFLARMTQPAPLNAGMSSGTPPLAAAQTQPENSWQDWLSQIVMLTSGELSGSQSATQASQTLLQMHTDTLDTFFRLLNQLWQPHTTANSPSPAFSDQHPLGQLLNQLLSETGSATGTAPAGKNLLEQLTRPLQQSGDIQQWLQFLTQPISGPSAYTAAVQHWLWQRLKIRSTTAQETDPLAQAQHSSTTVTADEGISALLQFLQSDKPAETGIQQPQLVLPLPLTRTEDETQWMAIQRGPRRADGESGWHITLDLPLGTLGLIRCQAYLDLPHISLRFQAERTQTVDRLQETLPELQQRLQSLGLTVAQCQIRQGKISRRAQQSRQETSGISIRI